MSLVGWALTVEIILAVLERTWSTSLKGPAQSVNIDVGDIVFGRVVIFPFYIDQALLMVVLSAKIRTVSAESRPRSFGDVADNFIAWNWVTAQLNPNQEARSSDNHATFVTDLEVSFLFSTLTSPPLTSSSASARTLARSSSRRSSSVKRLKWYSPNLKKPIAANKASSYSLIFVALCPCAFVHELIGYQVMLVELSHQEVTATVNRQFLVLIFKELTDLVACLASFNKGQPVTTRTKGLALVIIPPDLPSEVWYEGTIRPLTLAPIAFSPTLVWIS